MIISWAPGFVKWFSYKTRATPTKESLKTSLHILAFNLLEQSPTGQQDNRVTKCVTWRRATV